MESLLLISMTKALENAVQHICLSPTRVAVISLFAVFHVIDGRQALKVTYCFDELLSIQKEPTVHMRAGTAYVISAKNEVGLFSSHAHVCRLVKATAYIPYVLYGEERCKFWLAWLIVSTDMREGFKPAVTDCAGMQFRLPPIFLFDQFLLDSKLCSNPTLAQVQPPLL